MKTKTLTATCMCLFLGLGALSASEEANKPQGTLTASLNTVLADSNVDLSWKITYPPSADEDTEVTVQFITFAIGPKNTIKFGTKLTGGEYKEWYDGVSEEHDDYALTPGTTVAKFIKEAGKDIVYHIKHSKGKIPGGWLYSNEPSHSHAVIRLGNGDIVPSVAPVAGQRSVAEILDPYSEDGVMKLPANQEIILFEVWTLDDTHKGFDMQDLVLLVTQKQVDPNE